MASARGSRALMGATPAGASEERWQEPAEIPGRAGKGRATSRTSTTERVLDVFTACVDEAGQVSVTALAKRLGLSKAVVFRILRSLVGRGLLAYVTPSRQYTLGPVAFQLGARMLAGSDMRALALPIMRQLRDATGESVALGLLVGDHNTYIEQLPSFREVRMIVELGRPFPLYAGAQGKVTLAFADHGLLDRVLRDPLQPMTDRTITDRSKLLGELEAIRSCGWAVSLGERVSGAAAVAAPIMSMDGVAAGSIAICGPRDRFDEAAIRRYSDLVVDAAARVSERYGGRPPVTQGAPGAARLRSRTAELS